MLKDGATFGEEKRRRTTFTVTLENGKILLFVSVRPSCKGWLDASKSVWELNTEITMYLI
jgi:hypothetical protein